MSEELCGREIIAADGIRRVLTELLLRDDIPEARKLEIIENIRFRIYSLLVDSSIEFA